MAEETVREEKDFVHEIELHVVEKQVPQIEATSLTSPNSNTEIEEENQESEEEEEEKESEEEEEKEDPKFIETDQDQENFNYIQTYHIFENEDDRKGVISYLGERTACVEVIASSNIADSERNFIYKSKKLGCTENKEYSWFLVNFGDNFVIPTHYVIRYQGPDDKTEFKGKKPPKNLFPKCWILQATNDKSKLHDPTTWKILDIYDEKGFPFDERGYFSRKLILDKEQPYRIFRIIMRGENGSLDPDWKHCLALNSFELYGCLKRRISRRIYDFDPNSQKDKSQVPYGIIHGNRKNISIYSSPLKKGRARDFIKNNPLQMKTVNSLPVSVHTKDRYQSWFAVDFGYQVSVLPTHYSLRYAATEAENYQPKNWMLLATNDTNALKNDDDPNWVILDKQTNSSYLLKGDYVFHTWKIDHDYSIENGWRIFKVVQIDKNHGGNHVFAVTSFELYGFLKERRKSTQSPDDYLNLKSTPPSIHCNSKVISYKGRSKGIIDLLKETDNERIGVYSSSISKGKVRDFITKAKTPLGTKSEPFSWFAIDLGEGRTVFPQHYQLQFASTQVEFCPRNWLLQGTNKIESLYSSRLNDHINESEWVTLMTHQSDQTFNFPFEIGHWELQDLDKIRERYPQGFRIFRVIQVGSNRFEEGPFNEVFAVGGFDIYGTLYETCEQKIASGVFPFSQTSQEGIIFKLGKEKIAVFASGVQNGISEREFLSKQKVAFWSHDINNSWFGVDFGPLVSVKPNYYTLRFSHSGSNSPRNWLLQATNHPEALHRRISPTSDPEHDEYWTTLIKHKNDSSLDSSFAIHSWPIQSTEQFRIFRVIQVGPNKAGNHIFAVSGFELYGNLEVTTMYQINEHLFIYNVDREGIIQGLGALEDGQLEVYSSPLHEGTKEDILNHEEVHICTKNVKNAFVAVKFKFHSVVPTHYSFKYGSSENFYCPRNWVFQGSNDKDALKHFDTQGVWTNLSEHVNDTSLNTHFAHNTWVIPEEKRKSYTFFRILQTGPNNMDNEKWCNVLSLSGFEIFGALHEKVPSYITSFSTSSANTLTMPSNLSSFPSYSSSLFFSGFSPEIFFNQKKLTFRYSNNSNGIINELKDYLVVGSSNQLQGQPSDFISKEPLCCWTTCDDSSCPWFVVDLGITRKVIPTHYTIRSASTRNRYGPRNWLLQASNNMEIEKSLKEKLGLLTSGNMKSNTIENDLKTKSGLDVVNDPTWVTLKVHLNDRTIKTEFVDNTFRLNLPESKNEGYRFFRIIQIGPNALDEQETQNPLLKYPKHEIKDDRKNYLSVNGFELYGTLLFNSSIELYNDEEDEKLLRGLDAVPGIQKEDGIIEYLSKHPPNHSNKTSVMVYSSSIKRGKVRDFISDKQGLVVYSENEPNSWFAVDFGEKRAVIPERYAIRYANKSKFTFPTHWLFQASNKIEALSTSNPKSRLWRTLREHYNDYSLKNTFYRDRKEYPVELPDHYRKPYRFYRLIQVQENYANTNLEYSHTFSMSGFEIWGSLMEKTGTYSKKRQQAHQIISKNDMATKSVQLQHTICVQSFQAPSRIRCLEIIDDIIFVATDAPSIYSYFLNSGESTKKAFKGHTDGILWLTSSSDKKHLFSASWDTTIKIWDIDHDLCLHTFEGHRDAVTCLVVSNQLLFSCSNDGTIRIWDLVKYKSNKIIRAHSARISHMILHEKRLYSCSLDKTVKVWDYKDASLIDTFQCNIPVRFLVIKNGKLFCSCNNLLVNLTPQNNVGGNFAFDSQNFSMQTKEDKHSIIIVKNLETGSDIDRFFVNSLDHPHISCMVIDDEFLYSVCDSKKVLTIWNRRLKVPIETIETSFEGNLTWVSLGPESEIITGASDGKIQIWQKQRFNGINILKGHKGKIQTLHVDYRFIISGSSDHSIRIWNSSNGDLIKMIPTQSEINSMFVIDDRIYAGCADGHIRYWSIQSGECCFDLKGHKAPITDILVWDEKVISVSRDGYMNIFDTNGAGNKLREIPLFETNSSRSKEGNSFSFKRTKENLFVVSTDCKFRIISIKTWDIKYIEFNEKIRCLTVEEQDEDSVKLYMGCGTNIFIYIYNTKTKKLEQIDTLPEFHTENVRNLTVSQKILYSCGFDRVIAIWDLNEKKKKLKYRLTGHEAVVTRIKVLDQKLYSCSEDFSIIMWDLQLLLAPDLFFQSLNQDYLEFYPHDLDEFTSPDFHERNLLMFLCSFGTFECIKSLLHSIHFSQCKSCQNDEECDSKGDELTKTNKYGESGLFFLIKNERWSILSKLAHLIPQKKEFKMEKILNLLKQKAKYDDKEFFKAFTRCNILPDDKIPFVEILSPTFSIRDFPHLTLQFFSGHYNIFDSKNVDKKGRNLLHQACYYGCPKAVEVLLENPHVNVNAEDKDGYTAFRLALFQKSLEDIENAESHVAKQKKELLEKNESNKDLSLPEYFYEGNVGQDLLEGERGVRSVHELLMDRLKCASLILNISEGSKLPRLLLKNKKENRHGYHYLLMRNYDIQQTLKTPRRQIQDAQIIEESNLLFESVTDLVAIANNYPSVQIFRSRFSFTYFCRVAVPYFLWLILLCAMAVMNSTANDSSVYFFSQSIQDSLTNAQFQPLQNWYSIQKPTDFWTYVDGPLLQLLNLEAVLDPSSFKIIGAAEMLQVRVQRDSCPIPSSFQNDGLICYSSSLVQDTSSFGNSQQYHFESNKRAPFTGVQNTYPGSGFIETLPLSTNAYLNLTNNLQVDWIDNQTRAIVITFTLYNVNLNLFGVINLIAEFSSSGELLPTWKFSIIRNHIYFSASEVFLIIFQILTVAYFIYAFPLREIIEFKSKKDKTNYFKDGWNYYEWCIICIGFTIIGFHIAILAQLGSINVNTPGNEYVDFTVLERNVDIERDLISVFVFIALLRGLKYFRIFPYTGPTTLSLLDTFQARSFIVFIFIFVYIMLSIGVSFHLAFGTNLIITNTLVNSFLTMISLITANISQDRLSAANSAMGPFYYVVSVVLVTMLLLNIFIAVLSDIYIENQKTNNASREIMITYLIISQIRKKGAKKRYINPFKKLVNLLLDKLYPTEHSESHLDNISSDIEGESTKPPSGNTIFLNQADIKIKLMELDSQKSAVDNKALLGAIRNEVTNVIQLSEERQIKRTQVLENKLEELNSMVQDLSMAYKAQMKEKKLK